MSNTTNAVNPAAKNSFFEGLWNSLGIKEAYQIGAPGNIVPWNAEKTPTREERKEFAKKRDIIGTTEFNVADFSDSAKSLVEAYGFDKTTMQFIGMDDNETFQKILDVIDLVLSAVRVLPIDKIDKAKDCVRTTANILAKYVPDFQSIGKLLAMAPGIAKYSKALIGFGEAMDKAVSVLNIGGPNCVDEAVKVMKQGIEQIRSVDIIDVNRQVVEAKVHGDDIKSAPKPKTEAKKEETKADSKAEESKATDSSKKETKKPKEEKVKTESKSNTDGKVKEDDTVSDNTINDAAAFSQQFDPMNGTPMMSAMPGFIPEQTPSFLDGSLSKNPDISKSVPEYMAQNQMKVGQVDPRQRVFTPVEQQQQFAAAFGKYPFVNDIIKIANSNGYFCSAEKITDAAGHDVLIYIRVFNSQAFLPDKSFIIDLGYVIDKRFAIWPCAMPDGNFFYLEDCKVAYALMTRDDKLNASFVSDVIKYGFHGLNQKIETENRLYKERMTITNRVINLITLPDKGISKDQRNIVRGACIRMATKLDKSYGRFEFKSFNPKDLSFVLTNQCSEHFLVPPVQKQPVNLLCKPKLDEKGNTIRVNPNGGTDILYTVELI